MANVETEDTEDTTVLHLRDFPVELHTHLKVNAALARMPMRDFIINILGRAVSSSDEPRDDFRARAS